MRLKKGKINLNGWMLSSSLEIEIPIGKYGDDKIGFGEFF